MRRSAPHIPLVALLWAWASPGCTQGPPAAQVAAHAALAEALVERDPVRVSTAARAAAEYEGRDPSLDRLLGDALANVLMRPADGFALLRAHPAPHDEAWVRAMESAALRTADAAVLETTLGETGSLSIPAPETLVAWLGARALRDPQLDIDDLRAAAAACDLYDNQPTRGRRTVDQPAPDGFLETLPALGALRVVVGRAEVPPDPPPDTGRGLQPCSRGRLWPAPEWPAPLPKHVTVGIATSGGPLYLSVRPEQGAPWVFASTRADIAGELVALARDVHAGAPPAPQWLPLRLAGAPPPVAPPLAD